MNSKEETNMLQMPDATNLVYEMTKTLPLFCHSKKRNTKALASQGLILSEKTRLEVMGVRDLFYEGGIMCEIRYDDQVLVMSITGLDFIGNGPIDEKIAEYQKARIEWLKQEERIDREQGRGERIKVFGVTNDMPKISRNAPCTCGSGKKYKYCCGTQ